MTETQLQARTKKALADMARRKGIAGWQRLDKDQLIVALTLEKDKRPLKTAPRLDKKEVTAPPKSTTPLQTAAARKTSAARVAGRKAPPETTLPPKDLANPRKDLPGGFRKDRIVVMARDPYWLHAYWELTRQSVQRRGGDGSGMARR